MWCLFEQICERSSSCISARPLSASCSVTFQQDVSDHSLIGSSFMDELADRTTICTSGCCLKYKIKGSTSSLHRFRMDHVGEVILLFCFCWSFWHCEVSVLFCETLFFAKTFFLLSFFESLVNYLHRVRVYVLSIRRRHWATSPRGGGWGEVGLPSHTKVWASEAKMQFFSKGHHHPQGLITVFSSEARHGPITAHVRHPQACGGTTGESTGWGK